MSVSVDYSDGSQDTVTIGFGDWIRGYDGASTNAPGETTVLTTSFNQYSGTTESPGSGSANIYGYTIPVNPNKTVTALQLGNNNAVDILAIDLVPHPEQVNLGYGNSSGVALPYNEIGISSTNGWNHGGIDSAGDTYSAAAAPAGLGNSVTWNSQTFVFGPGGTNNVVEADGQSITLAGGRLYEPRAAGRVDLRLRRDRCFPGVLYQRRLRHLYPGVQRLDGRVPRIRRPRTTAPGESIVEIAVHLQHARIRADAGNRVSLWICLPTQSGQDRRLYQASD